MVKCMCKDSAGSNFISYVLDRCYPEAPDQLKGVILATVQEQSTRGGICQSFLAYTTDKLQNSLEPFFSELYLASDGVGDSVDYLLRVGGSNFGLYQSGSAMEDTCSNYQTNPFVVAIIPEPVDYFRPCGYTSTCRMRCKAELQAFESAANSVGSKPVTRTTATVSSHDCMCTIRQCNDTYTVFFSRRPLWRCRSLSTMMKDRRHRASQCLQHPGSQTARLPAEGQGIPLTDASPLRASHLTAISQ